jgi:hypothetical protein
MGSGRVSVIRGNRSGGDKPRPYEGNVAMRGFVGEGLIPSRARSFELSGR